MVSLVRYIQNELGVQNVTRGTELTLEYTERLLSHTISIDSKHTPGYLWNEYETDTFRNIPRHPRGHKNGKAYLARPLKQTPTNALCKSVDDYWLTAEGFTEIKFL